MRVSSNTFQEFLAPDESVVDWFPGTLFDDQDSSEGAIAVTDRRLLFVSKGDRFLDVAHEAVGSIQSRPTTTYTPRGLGYRSAAVVGGILALSGFVGVMVLDASVSAFLLWALAVGGFVVAEYVRRSGVYVEWSALDAPGRALKEEGGDFLEELADAELLRRPKGDGNEGGDNDPLIVGIVIVSLFATIGLIGLTGSLFAVPLVLVALGGIASADYAYRRTRRLDSIGGSRRREREVTLHLVGGHTVTLRVDPAEPVHLELSGVVRGAGQSDEGVALTRPQA